VEHELSTFTSISFFLFFFLVERLQLFGAVNGPSSFFTSSSLMVRAEAGR